jgi:hypothetical protein
MTKPKNPNETLKKYQKLIQLKKINMSNQNYPTRIIYPNKMES